MFNLFGKKKDRLDFGLVGTDMHSHLLPGIDDGAGDMEDALELIKGLVALGYKKLITTPHILWDMYKNTPATIAVALEGVKAELAAQKVDVELSAAAEYFMDEHFEELLDRKEPLLAISDNKVLTEFSMMYPPVNIKELVFKMQMQGYQPIIAHPERYIYLQQNKEFYHELSEMGCLFQLNILSLSGGYGRSVTELSRYLLKNNFYSLIGTDIHHYRHLEALQRVEMTADLKNLLESRKLLNHFL